MTPDQFKAWFEGFCEAIDAAPTPEQWARIKAKVADIREKPAATLREPEFKRQWADTMLQNDVERTGPLVLRGGLGHNARPISPERPFAAGRIPVSHETRVVDPATGADLGPSD